MKLSYLKSKTFWLILIVMLTLTYLLNQIFENITGFSPKNPIMILMDFASIFGLCVYCTDVLRKKLEKQWSPAYLILSIIVAIPFTAFVYWAIFKSLTLSTLSDLDEYFGYPFIVIWVSAIIIGIFYGKKKI
jgi:hypothetical protein